LFSNHICQVLVSFETAKTIRYADLNPQGSPRPPNDLLKWRLWDSTCLVAQYVGLNYSRRLVLDESSAKKV